MSKLVKYELPDNSTILVEVDDIRVGATPVARGGIPEKAQQSFEQAIDSVRPAAEAIINKLRDLSQSPDEVEIKFSVKFTGETSAIIAKTSLEGNFEITIKWKKNEKVT